MPFAQDDRGELQDDDQVDDAVAGAEAMMWLLEPGGQDAIFGQPVQYAVCPNNGSVLGSRQNQYSDQHDKPVKDQLGPSGPTRYMAIPPIRFAKKLGRTLSGMIITAKNETSEVNSRL